MVGFALESKCHTGQTVIYDAVGKLGWSVDVRTHRIGTLIEKLLIPDWAKDAETAAVAIATPTSRPIASHEWLEGWGWPWPGRRKRKDDEKDPDKPDDGTPSATVTSTSSSPEPTATQPPQQMKSHVPKPEINANCTDCFKWEYFDDYDGMPGRGGNKTKDGDGGKGGEPDDPPDPWAAVFNSWMGRVGAQRRYRAPTQALYQD